MRKHKVAHVFRFLWRMYEKDPVCLGAAANNVQFDGAQPATDMKGYDSSPGTVRLVKELEQQHGAGGLQQRVHHVQQRVGQRAVASPARSGGYGPERSCLRRTCCGGEKKNGAGEVTLTSPASPTGSEGRSCSACGCSLRLVVRVRENTVPEWMQGSGWMAGSVKARSGGAVSLAGRFTVMSGLSVATRRAGSPRTSIWWAESDPSPASRGQGD